MMWQLREEHEVEKTRGDGDREGERVAVGVAAAALVAAGNMGRCEGWLVLMAPAGQWVRRVNRVGPAKKANGGGTGAKATEFGSKTVCS